MDLTLLLIIGGGVVLLALVIGLIVSLRSQKSEVDERIGRFAGDEKQVLKRKNRIMRCSPIGSTVESKGPPSEKESPKTWPGQI